MDRLLRRRFARLALALLAVPTLCGVLACGSGESALDRGLTVDEEQAVPGSAEDFDLSEVERQAQEEREDAKKSAEDFEASQE
jgi:hypothetical protein